MPKSSPKDMEDSLTTNSSLMTIVDPCPDNIEVYQPFLDSGEGLLDAFLQIQWWVFWRIYTTLNLSCPACRGSKWSFDTHIWMLKTLLGISKDLKSFNRYVISASFPKMCRRLDGGPILKCYFNCLLNLEKTTFQFIKYPDSETTDKDDHSFLSIIPSLKTKTDISNLKQMAGERAKNPGLMPCAIYNKDTYLEFHRLSYASCSVTSVAP